MTSAQFLEWARYAELEPFDEVRADLRSAIIATVIANVNRGKAQKAYTVDDFMPNYEGKTAKKQTWQEMKAMGLMFAELYSP